ncbi:MAG: MFS transporter [Chloroflexota bacterium]|nr:MFS transporter [Chloroflexota bacterium]MDE3193085.1 MFS transporter [Chloroflexota bacterium]
MRRAGAALREELLERGALVNYVVCVAATTAEGMLQQLYAPYLSASGHALPFIGILTSLIAVTRLLSRLPVGTAYRPERARGLILASAVALTLTILPFAVSGAAIVVVPFTLLHGLAFGAITTVNLAATIDATGGRRAGAIMAWYTAALSTGYALGAFFGGAAGDALGLRSALVLTALIPLVGLIAAFWHPRLTPSPARPPAGGRGLSSLLAAAREVDTRVWLAFVVVLYSNLLSDSVDYLFPLYALGIGLPLAASGILKGLKSSSATVIRFGSLALFRWVDHATINSWGVIAMGVAMFLLPVAPGFPALVGLFVVAGLCRGILRVTSAATVADMRADGKEVGLASAIYNAGLDVGSIVGPGVAGVVGSGIGLGAMFQVMAVGALVMYFAVALSTAAGRASLSFRGRARSATAR